jgi:hypothetical protein
MTYEEVPANYSGWAVGWTGFAGVMLIIIGVMDIIQGIVGLANDTFYVLGDEYVFEFSITTWAWIHIIVGVILLLAGIGLFSGNVLARIVGVIVASLAMIVNFAWLPYYPIWSIVMIAISIAIIWALTAHGRDITYS